MSCLRSHTTLLMLIYVYALLTWYSDALEQRRKHRHRISTRPSEGLPFELQQAYHNELLQRSNDVPESATQPSTTTFTQPDILSRATMGSGEPDAFTSTNMSNYVPRIPVPEESDCKVEIEIARTVLQVGRCTRLSGINGPYICQSGERIEFQPTCREKIENRQRQSIPQLPGT